jgi:A/G-specific adenine glycosylase
MIEVTPQKAAAFRRRIFAFYKKHGRKLWFRETSDPYKIAISEIMLQQTQVERVMEYYPAWIKRWPDWKSLAQATNQEVLSMWSGLGYNRRALYLKRLAKTVVHQFDGQLPADYDTLRTLPGIGPYTARAILVFAFGKRLAAVDTNVRKVLRHEFNLPVSTSDSEIEALARQLLPRRKVKEWHHALMDYARLALRSRAGNNKGNVKRDRYQGSRRQIRGAIIRHLTFKKRVALSVIARELGKTLDEIKPAALALQKEGMVVVRGRSVYLQEESFR